MESFRDFKYYSVIGDIREGVMDNAATNREGAAGAAAPYWAVSAFQLAVSLLLAFILLWPNLYASWGLVDDHDIIGSLGMDHKVSVADYFTLLSLTEVGEYGEALRFRPVYFMLRVLEMVLWGGNAHLWYAFTWALFAFGVFLTWRAASRYLGMANGFMITLLFLSHAFWANIYAGLGSAEIYAFPLLALYCGVFMRLWEGSGERPGILWGGLTLASVLLIGIKENFFITLPFTFLLAARWLWQGRVRAPVYWYNAALAVWAFIIAVSVILGIRSGGGDIYGNDVSITGRLGMLTGAIGIGGDIKNLISIAPCILTASAMLAWRLVKPGVLARSGCMGILWRSFWIQLGCAVVWVSQYVFYHASWPTGMRYDFPGLLARDLAFVSLAYAACVCLVQLLKGSWPEKRVTAGHMLFLVMLGAICFVPFYKGRILALQEAAIKNAVTTRKLGYHLERVSLQAAAHPDYPLIYEVNNVWDAEPVVAMDVYLASRGIHNRHFMLLFNEGGMAFSRIGIEYALYKLLKNMSDNGGMLGRRTRVEKHHFYPARLAILDGRCIAIGFSAEPQSNCLNAGRAF